MGTHPIFESDFDCLTEMSDKFRLVATHLARAQKSGSFWSRKVKEPPFDFAVQIGDPRLRLKSKNVEVTRRRGGAGELTFELDKPGEIKELITKMEKCAKSGDCYGLSAPQVGVNLRVLMFSANMKENEEHFGMYEETESTRFRTLINPSIIGITPSPLVDSLESCLSIPILAGVVPRNETITVAALEYINESNTVREIHENFTGPNSFLLQHELDHLDGILFIDRIKDLNALGDPHYLAIEQGFPTTRKVMVKGYRSIQMRRMLPFILLLLIFGGLNIYNYKDLILYQYLYCDAKDERTDTFTDWLIPAERRAEIEARDAYAKRTRGH